MSTWRDNDVRSWGKLNWLEQLLFSSVVGPKPECRNVGFDGGD